MFGNGKKVEELTQEINRLNSENQELKNQIDLLTKSLSTVREDVEKNNADIHEIEEKVLADSSLKESVGRSLRVLKSGMSLLIDKDKNTSDVNRAEEERWNDIVSHIGELDSLRERKKDSISRISSPRTRIEKSIGDLSTIISSLSDVSKNMSVLSLNSAIEAGHFGENAKNYVETAEKIRVMSEGYKAKAEMGLKTLVDIRDGFYSSFNEADSLDDIFAKESAEIKRISEESEEYLKMRKKQNDMEESFSADSLITELDSLEKAVDKIDEKFHILLEKMKYVTSNSEKNEELLNRLTDSFN